MSFKVGDTVEIILNTCYHGFEIGEKVVIESVIDYGNTVVYESSDQFKTPWRFTNSDINCEGERK